MVLATLTRESAGRVRRLQIGKRSPRRAPGAGGCLLRTCAGSTTRVPSAPEWSWRRSHVNPPVEFDVFRSENVLRAALLAQADAFFEHAPDPRRAFHLLLNGLGDAHT